jgi:pseudouridine kinase
MQVTCIGGACVDRSYRVHGNAVAGSSNPATRALPLFGGVARNVSENLARLRIESALFSAVGNDALGAALLDELRTAGVDVDLVKIIEGSSDEYAAILERGELVLGAADMRAIESLSVDDLDRRWETLAASAWLFVDCNLSAAILQACLARRSIGRYKLAIDAVSEPKAQRLPARLDPVDVLFINEGEACAYLGTAGSAPPEELASALLARGARSVVLTGGDRGLICGGGTSLIHVPATPVARVCATGAGDALVAGTLWRLIAGDSLHDAVRTGAELAALTLQTDRSVRADLSPGLLDRQIAARPL